jgi:hypothetical protein
MADSKQPPDAPRRGGIFCAIKRMIGGAPNLAGAGGAGAQHTVDAEDVVIVGERRKASKKNQQETQGDSKKTRTGGNFSAAVLTAQHDACMLQELSVDEEESSWWSEKAQSLGDALTLLRTPGQELAPDAVAQIREHLQEVNAAAAPIWETCNREAVRRAIILAPMVRLALAVAVHS